jgi:hypothetical protein
MRLTPPKNSTFTLSAILVILGVLGIYVNIPILTDNTQWFFLGGYAVLFLGTLLAGL